LCRGRERLPIERFAKLNKRRNQLDLGQQLARLSIDNAALARDRIDLDGDQMVDKGQNALDPMFGQHNRDAKVGVEAHQSLEHIVGGLGVELRGRLVEHQNRWAEGERGGDCDALLLPSRERIQFTFAQIAQVQQAQNLFDPNPHLLLGDSGVFERKGDLVFDLIDDKLGFGVLKNKADMAAHHLG
jgi:hypothetical protein